MFSLLTALLLIFVAPIFGESMTIQVGLGTDLPLCWPFYGLWVNIVVATVSSLQASCNHDLEQQVSERSLLFPTAIPQAELRF